MDDLLKPPFRQGVISSGKQLGRPKGSLGRSKLEGREAEIERLLSKGVSKTSIAKITDVSRTNLLHFIRSRQLEANR